jgi:hypothetical protein
LGPQSQVSMQRPFSQIDPVGQTTPVQGLGGQPPFAHGSGPLQVAWQICPAAQVSPHGVTA